MAVSVSLPAGFGVRFRRGDAFMAAFPLQTVLGEDRHSWSVNLPASYCLCRDAITLDAWRSADSR